MSINANALFRGFNSGSLVVNFTCYCVLLLVIILPICQTQAQQDNLVAKSLDSFTIELSHKFDPKQEFKPRGSILVRPRSDRRTAQITLNQVELTDSDLAELKEASDRGGTYSLKATLKKREGDKLVAIKTTQTLIKACSLYVSNLADFITINLGPFQDFVSINTFTTEPECIGQTIHSELSRRFNTSVQVDSIAVAPAPDTETFIQRIEEEARNKSKQGKEDNRSFFAKYWIYIVPAVVILMLFSGPPEGGR